VSQQRRCEREVGDNCGSGPGALPYPVGPDWQDGSERGQIGDKNKKEIPIMLPKLTGPKGVLGQNFRWATKKFKFKPDLN
jgi:hypothetical protein